MSWGERLTFSFLSTPQHRFVWLIRVQCLAWIVLKIISWPLWSAERLYPVVPVFNSLSGISTGWHLTLTVSSLGLLFFLLLRPKARVVAGVLVLIEVSSCVLDLTRLQPWEYQFVVTAATVALCRSEEQLLKYALWWLGATYFFSGLNKCCGAYLYFFWDREILYGLLHLKASNHPLLHYLGLGTAVLEASIGLGLIFLKRKQIAAWGVVAICLVIMALLGPHRTGFNLILLPWNTAMALSALILCYKPVSLKVEKATGDVVLLMLAWILPMAGLWGKWPQYCSFNLYSGNIPYLQLCTETTSSALQPYTTPTNRFCPESSGISIFSMTEKELRVPPLPELWYYEKLKLAWEARFPENPARFIIYRHPFHPEELREIP